MSDLDLLVRHRREMWEAIGDRDPQSLDEADLAYKMWVSTRLKNRTFLGWLATTGDGEVAGTGCIWLQPVQPRPGNKKKFQPYLLSMYTEPAYRGRGVATEIVKEAIKWAKKNDFSVMRLHASEMGRGVYRKLGFERSWEMRMKFGPKGSLDPTGPLDESHGTDDSRISRGDLPEFVRKHKSSQPRS